MRAGLFGAGARAAPACLPPAGHFSPRKSAENAPGAAAPGLPWGPAACIPRKGISQAVTLHRAVLSHTACPFPASRGPVESDSRYGYRTFLKGRTDCHRTWGRHCTRQFFAEFPYWGRRGAHCTSVPRSGLLWRERWLRKADCTTAPPKAPLCKGPARERRQWRKKRP